jgi:membrane-associated phospholipid phosphatase
MGSMFFPLLIKLKNRRWSDPKKILGVSLILGWAIFVGVSRILIGAHYASDVLFSIGMTSIITIVLYKRVYKNSS